MTSRDGEPGHNYLCAGLELFFTHTRPLMGVMGQLFKRGRPPAEVMLWVRNEDSKRDPYAPCPCGGGKKFKFCHGRAPAKAQAGSRAEAINSLSLPRR